ncbi:MAG: 50S ribosomal protein L2 [Planctomycetes bacterium]|nr:50S ribosomal protein L2 [Planctomycetota bacterium]NUQ35611.1 50S ribosomal protein L2 [Planctomycetaceae bacterium]
MPIKTFQPRTPSLRFTQLVDYSELTASKPEKSLVRGKHSSGGRNNRGRVSTLNVKRGGGHKRRYRDVDFKRRKDGIVARVKTVEYDPNRSCFISLVAYEDGEKCYILSPHGIKIGAKIVSGARTEPDPGNCMEIGYIPQGLQVHNIEMRPGQGGKIARGAGAYATVQGRDGDHVIVLLPSGESRKVNYRCRATLGQLSNLDHFNVHIGKAGRHRWMGKRPRVSGNSKNPCDHPMGGGNDHTGGGRQPCDAFGRITKGRRTRKPRKPSNSMIVRSRRGRMSIVGPTATA